MDRCAAKKRVPPRLITAMSASAIQTSQGGLSDAVLIWFTQCLRRLFALGAMKKSDITWDEKTLAEYLKDPKAKVPDTKMTFIGLRQAQQLEDMIAFLKKATQ